MLTSCLFDEDINLFISLITFKGGTQDVKWKHIYFIYYDFLLFILH